LIYVTFTTLYSKITSNHNLANITITESSTNLYFERLIFGKLSILITFV